MSETPTSPCFFQGCPGIKKTKKDVPILNQTPGKKKTVNETGQKQFSGGGGISSGGLASSGAPANVVITAIRAPKTRDLG